jgi:5-methylcytosine-specific restriction endonuclease McrA
VTDTLIDEHGQEWKIHPKAGYVYRIVDRKVVYQHREILFAALGLGPHGCSYCGEQIDWLRANNQTHGSWDGILVVDHRDHDRGNNTLANLAAACQRCNMRRRMAFIKSAERPGNIDVSAASPPVS